MGSLVQSLVPARRRPCSVALIFLDLDRFKVVNDSLCHAIGDDLLVEVARRLEGVMRSADTVARMGGDEFVVLVEDVVRVDEAVALARRLRTAISAPITVAAGQRVVLTASVGVAVSTERADGVAATPSSLLWDADVAMYRAKDDGRHR